MRHIISALLIAALSTSVVYARNNGFLHEVEAAVEKALQPSAVTVPATGEMEVAFSPNGGGEELVIKTIDSARSSIRMLAYSFTSAPMVSALLRAKKRNVDVAIAVDYKHNISGDRSGKAKAALGALVNAGVAVRTIDAFQIHHDKTVVVDGRTVQTGSFNYSDSAEKRNSENVLVIWNNPKLAAVYEKHWNRNWSRGKDYAVPY